MEAYKKVGRGGAGNFYSKKDVEDATKTGDTESQTTGATQPTINPTPKPAPEYSHSGRGGAGNWFQPSTLQSQGLTQATTDSSNGNPTSTTAPSTMKAIGHSKPAYRGGRGGAGNYIDLEGEKKREIEELERKRLEMEGRVERDVEAGLARPERAYGGVTGAWEMK